MQTQKQQALHAVTPEAGTQAPAKKENFIQALADNQGMTAQQYWGVLKNTILKDASDAEANAFLMVAHQYRLNPFLKEIQAFKTQGGGIMPMVPIDGWITMVNRNPLFAGYETAYPPEDQWVDRSGKKVPAWIEVTMFRRDSDKAYPHREYLDECFKDTGPWKSHPKRMLKHKAFIQSARYALGFSGIYDEDEVRNIVDITPSGYDVLPPEAPDTSAFDEMAGDMLSDAQFMQFVTETARASNCTVDALKVEAAKHWDGFVAAFQGWAKKPVLDAAPTIDLPTQPEPEKAAKPKAHPKQQAQAAPESILCPNDPDENGNPQSVYVTMCDTCTLRDACPSWQK